MLQEILTRTPTYVWAILAFLVYRGVAASKDRLVTVRSALIIPVVMLVLGLHGTASAFGLQTPAGAAWLGGLLAGAALAWSRPASISMDHGSGMLRQAGSWMPLALMMSIFIGKYALAVALAAQPALRHSLPFAIPACLMLGVCSGIFVGRLSHARAAWAGRQVPA